MGGSGRVWIGEATEARNIAGKIENFGVIDVVEHRRERRLDL
jgi:hypothetical protein